MVMNHNINIHYAGYLIWVGPPLKESFDPKGTHRLRATALRGVRDGEIAVTIGSVTVTMAAGQ